MLLKAILLTFEIFAEVFEMPFLQDLKTGILAAQLELDDNRRTGKSTFDAESKLLALNEVWTYVKGGAWHSKPDSVARIIDLVELDRKAACEKYGMTVNNVNTALWRANTILENKFGTELISRILAGDINKSMLEFRCKSGTLLSDGVFLKEAGELLPKPDGSIPYKLSDCISEAKLLAFYSREMLNKRFGAIDKQKLAYLVYLLNTYNSALDVEQRALYHVVCGDVNANSLDGVVNPLNSVYFDELRDKKVEIE